MRFTSVFIFAVVLLLNAVPALAGGQNGSVPEPSSMLLLGTGLAGVAAYRLRRSKR